MADSLTRTSSTLSPQPLKWAEQLGVYIQEPGSETIRHDVVLLHILSQASCHALRKMSRTHKVTFLQGKSFIT